jgi:hypothetical protein
MVVEMLLVAVEPESIELVKRRGSVDEKKDIVAREKYVPVVVIRREQV